MEPQTSPPNPAPLKRDPVEWARNALAYVEQYARMSPEFSTEEVWTFAEADGFPRPPHINPFRADLRAWNRVMHEAKRQRMVQFVTIRAPMRREEGRPPTVVVWKSLIVE